MKVPVQTENIALALALHLAGVPAWDEKSFAFVVYDDAQLKKLGCSTIKEAMAKNLCGHRVCSFDPKASELVSAYTQIWDDEKQRIVADLPSEVEVSAEDMVRIVARVLHCRKQITQNWQALPIYAHISNGPTEFKQAAPGESLSISPGYRMVNIRASLAVLDRLHLAPDNE